MLSKKQVVNQMQVNGALEITAHFENVSIAGRAHCDPVAGTQGKIKLRAKFGNGVKAVLSLEEYGKTWEAEEAEETDLQSEEVITGLKATNETQGREQIIKIVETDAKNSRQTYYDAVQKWRSKYPSGSKKACSRELRISLPTVRRHWNR